MVVVPVHSKIEGASCLSLLVFKQQVGTINRKSALRSSARLEDGHGGRIDEWQHFIRRIDNMRKQTLGTYSLPPMLAAICCI